MSDKWLFLIHSAISACNICCKLTATAALVVLKNFRGFLEWTTDSFYCNACHPKYRISHLIRCFLIPTRKLSPKVILHLKTRKNCRLLNVQKYLANYRVHLITCVLWGRKYGTCCIPRDCDHLLWCLILWLSGWHSPILERS